MANTVTITKTLDGPRHAVFHVYIKSDGASGELTDEVLIDPQADITPVCDMLVVEEITSNVSGFSCRLEFDTGLVEDKVIWVIPDQGGYFTDFKSVGGFKDRSGLDGTGKLQLTTTGFTAAGDEGSILLKVRKKWD